MLALGDGTNSCPAGNGLNPKNKKFLMADFDAEDVLFWKVFFNKRESHFDK